MKAPCSRTLADLIFEQAERYGARPAAIWHDQLLSYAEHCRRAVGVAASLRDRGVERGDRVGLLVNNRPETQTGSHGNACSEVSSGINAARTAGIACCAIVSGVQPSARCTMRTGRGELNR
jgi:hypothetical protein